MPISQNGRTAALAIRGDEPWHTLVTITHPSMTTLRLVNAPYDIVSRANTYQRSGFMIELPSGGDGVPVGKARVWNVRRRISRLIESLHESPVFTIECVLPSDLDTVIDSYDQLKLSRVIADIDVIEGTLTQQSILDEPLPAGRMTEQYFPWLGR